MRLLELFNLTEAKTFKVEVYSGRELPIYVNPSIEELETILKTRTARSPELRGLTDPDSNNVYWWDSNEAIHTHVAQKIGLEHNINHHWYIFLDENDNRIKLWHPVFDTGATARKHPYINRIISSPRVQPYNESISEAKVIKAGLPSWTLPVRVYVNPSIQELLQRWRKAPDNDLRALYQDGTIYWWDSHEATHKGMQNALGLQSRDGWYLDKRSSTTKRPTLRHSGYPHETAKRAAKNPYLRRILKDPRFAIGKDFYGREIEPLIEAKAFKLEVYKGREFPVLVNPTPRELAARVKSLGMKDMRGFTDKASRTTYWWEASQAIHRDVAQTLGMVDNKDEHWHIFVNDEGYGNISMNLWHPFYDTKIAVKKNPYMTKISSDPLFGIQESITESKVIKAHIYNVPLPVKVMVNPTSNDLLAFWSNLSAKSVRGITYKDGDSYWWDSYDATHSDLLMYLSEVLDKYSESHEWYLNSEGGVPTLRHAYDPVNTEALSKGYPYLRKILRNPKIRIAYKGY